MAREQYSSYAVFYNLHCKEFCLNVLSSRDRYVLKILHVLSYWTISLYAYPWTSHIIRRGKIERSSFFLFCNETGSLKDLVYDYHRTQWFYRLEDHSSETHWLLQNVQYIKAATFLLVWNITIGISPRKIPLSQMVNIFLLPINAVRSKNKVFAKCCWKITELSITKKLEDFSKYQAKKFHFWHFQKRWISS